MQQLVHQYLAGNTGIPVKTPSYVYFPDQLERNIRSFNAFFKNGIKVFYAMKANNHAPLVQTLMRNGYGFDVASKEELHFVRTLGAPAHTISFSAPSKKEEDILYANTIGVKNFAFDSEEEAKKIMRIVKDPILFARIAAHSKDATFNLSSKFGMFEDYFTMILRKGGKHNWPIRGITFHVGSQNSSAEAWRLATVHTEKLIILAERFGVKISHLNVGGGIPAQYDNEIMDTDYYIERIITFCHKIKKRFPGLEIFVEPGRALCANTMVLLSRVIDVKPYKKPPMLIVDTGVFNGIIEPIEHCEYPICSTHLGEGRKKFFRVAGFSCEGYDVIRQKVLLPAHIKIGDLLPIMYAGAYTFVYENFHMVPFPPITLATDLPSVTPSQKEFGGFDRKEAKKSILVPPSKVKTDVVKVG